MSQRVLVTGGAGYIGCVLIPQLLSNGYRVRVFDKLVFGSGGLSAVQGDIELIPGDIREIPAHVFEGVDSVIHLAGMSNDPTAEYNPKANDSINTQGTIVCAQQAKTHGVARFIFASSCSVYYTPWPDNATKHEETPIAPTAPYSFSKYEAEKALLALRNEHFQPVILRKGTVFGVSPRMRYDLVVNTFVRDAYERGELTIHAGGQMWRPMLHIEDAAEAYVAALRAPLERVGGHVFNVLSRNLKIIDIAHETRTALRQRNGKVRMNVQPASVNRSYRVSGEKLEKTLGLTLGRDIGSAAVKIWDLLERDTDVNNPIYYNIRWLELLVTMKRNLEQMGGGPF